VLARSEIRAHARKFWEDAGGRDRYGLPAGIERAGLAALPLVIKRFERLTLGDIRRFVTRLGYQDPTMGEPNNRLLRGCLFADLDIGLLFVDSTDDAHEQRVTVAHEIAHFVLHYLEPRRRAVQTFGAPIISVLNRTRPPTRGEQFSSSLRDVPLEPWRHAMGRQAAGGSSKIEAEADDLAVELLAPIDELRGLNAQSAEEIAQKFGLPIGMSQKLFQLTKQPAESAGILKLFQKR